MGFGCGCRLRGCGYGGIEYCSSIYSVCGPPTHRPTWTRTPSTTASFRMAPPPKRVWMGVSSRRSSPPSSRAGGVKSWLRMSRWWRMAKRCR